MKHSLVKDLMKCPVITCEASCLVKDVAKLMEEHNIGFIPIIKNHFIVGIVSEKDIVRRGIVENKLFSPIEDIMNTDEVICVRSDDTLIDAARIMAQFRVDRLLVTYNGIIRGLLTSKHLLKNGYAIETITDAMNRPKVLPCYLKFANFNSDDAIRIDDYCL